MTETTSSSSLNIGAAAPPYPRDALTGRPTCHRRGDYTSFASPERFIVPLLRRTIEAALTEHALAPAPPGGRALDVGCGRQPLRRQLEAAGYRYAGMDAAQNAEGSVDFVGLIDASVLPEELLATEPFDLLVCTEVLEHVAHWECAFAHMAQLLKAGGRLLVTCPQVYMLHEEPYDFWRPTPHALRRFADLAKLNEVVVQTNGTAWDVLGTVLAGFMPLGRRDSISSRVLAWTVNKLRQTAIGVLNCGFIQKRVDLTGKLYLSNLAIFEKPAER